MFGFLTDDEAASLHLTSLSAQRLTRPFNLVCSLKTADVRTDERASASPRGTLGRRSVRILQGGPQLHINPSRIPLSEPGFASCAALGSVKKEKCKGGTNFTLSLVSRAKIRSL